MELIINDELSHSVLMAGNYYKHHHPGGISAVVQYWAPYFSRLQYYPTYRLSNIMVRAGWFLTSYIRMGAKMAFDRRVEIVHLHSAADGSFWRKVRLTRLAKVFGKKIVLHIHASRFKDFYNEASESKQRWIRRELDDADTIIALSESWREWFESIGIEPGKIEVLRNITSHPVVRPEAHVSDGKVRLLFMGEIGQRKGVFDILRAIADHRDELKGRIELSIGGNRNEEELIAAIRENGLEEIVKFEGWVGGDKKIDLLNRADIFILPSYNEGLPISILEAMSYGHPIISTPVGGIPEVVATDVNGVIVEPGNHEQIYRAIKKYIDHSELIEKEGAESRRRAAPHLPESVLRDLRGIYERLLSD